MSTPDEDDLTAAAEDLGEDVDSDEVYDLAAERARVREEETEADTALAAATAFDLL